MTRKSFGDCAGDYAASWRRTDAVWTRVDWQRFSHDHVLNGRRMHYVDVGSGPALLLIHGQGGSWRFWLRVIPALARRCRVIAVDLPGFGDSDLVGGNAVIDEQVRWLADLIHHLGLARAVLAGHSMGGLATMQTATEHPEIVGGVALVDAGGSPIGPKRLSFILGGFRVFEALFRSHRLSRFVARHRLLAEPMFAAAVADRRALSPALALEILPRMAAPGFVATMRAAAAALAVAAPEAIHQPSLIVWGDRDRILPIEGGRALSQGISRSTFVSLPGVGHCPMIEAPDELAVLLADFTVATLDHRARTVTVPVRSPDDGRTQAH